MSSTRLDDDLTDKLTGFEAVPDDLSPIATEIGLRCGRGEK